jgi:excisionase family DNA binding protein
LPYIFKVKALTENQPTTVSVIADVNSLAELLLAKLAPIVTAAPSDGTPEGYWTVAEASSYMSCDRQRIYDLNSQGRLRCVKDGKRLLTRRAWIDDYLEGCS